MYATLGWMLLAGLPFSDPTTIDRTAHDSVRPPVATARRVAVWTDRDDDPYDRGEPSGSTSARSEPSHVAVFRVDTDGRIRVLFPREPWGETCVRASRDLEVSRRPGRPHVRRGRRPRHRLSIRGRLAEALRLSTTSRGATTGTTAPSRAAASAATRTCPSPTSPRASRRATTTTTTSLPTTWNAGTSIPGSSATTATPTPSTTSGIPTGGPAPGSGS